jgi:hypothetical protein
MEGGEQQVDADQLVALRRLRAVLGSSRSSPSAPMLPPAMARPRGGQEYLRSTMGDPRRMTPAQLAEAAELLRRAVTTPAPAMASDALDELLRRLLVLHRLLEAELRATGAGQKPEQAGHGGDWPISPA